MMAAVSRLPARSTLQRGAGFEKLPATVTHPNTSESTRLTKRKRDNSQDYESHEVTKKQRVQPHSLSRPQSKFPTPTADVLPSPQNAAVKDSVTQTDHSQDRDVVQHSVGLSTIPPIDPPSLTLQLNAATAGPLKPVKHDEKRALRSHDGGSRIKSELAQYFANYDDIVSNEPKEPDYLTAATRIHIVDEPSKPIVPESPEATPLKHSVRKTQPQSSPSVSSTQPTASTSKDLILLDAQRIKFPTIDHNTRTEVEDPLNDDVYAKAHRRAERSEKQLRNIEKERSMHEKAQLERLLESLKGHDWLKVMGVSGVTDGAKKSWESKRDYFIQEVEALLEKFREWKEEEKRRKAEREERLYGDEEAGSDNLSRTETPDYSDVDALAARQLHHETATATGVQKRSHKRKARYPTPPSVEKPFTSFYSKPYLREAALGKHRRGRTRFAFGQPLPNVQERDFDLPDGLLTNDALAASARSRRRVRRESKV